MIEDCPNACKVRPIYMPSKYRLKTYKSGGIYHIYNRGIDGRVIFQDENDYKYFVDILKKYLLQSEPLTKEGYKSEKPSLVSRRALMKLDREINLLAFCLMSDHFHLLVKQNSEDGIVKFMRRVFTTYSMYFNKRYHREGNLFSGVYKAVLVENKMEVLYLSRFIHLNPASRPTKRFGLVETVVGMMPEYYMYSSMSTYLNTTNREFVDTSVIRDLLKDLSYAKFLEESKDTISSTILKGLMIDQ